MKKNLSFIFMIVLNSIVINSALGFLWYKLGFVKPTFNMMSGTDTLQMVFLKNRHIYFFIIGVIEFIIILLFRNLFENKKDFIKYYIISFVISIFLLLNSTIGFNTGLKIDAAFNVGNIKTFYIFVACLGLRYEFWILILNIPTLLGFLLISYKKPTNLQK